MKFKGGEDGIVPKGELEELHIEVYDELVLFHFKNRKNTIALNRKHLLKGLKSKYVERYQKTFLKYPGMSQKEIVEDLKNDFKNLNIKFERS